ncbi:hypothetical protein P0Y35_18625 [Kiritimatiellaeota bacterium B1221]|nr:hypothetical protein [Kiritimatiellaeota bacterium B1221]
MKKSIRNFLPVIFMAMISFQLQAAQVTEISQYGITWTFSQPVEAGQFVSGDWWVVGPVEIVSVSPEPGPSASDKETESKSIYGATSLVTDTRMRNGSMVHLGPDAGHQLNRQGFDSRSKTYDPSLSISFPYTLEPNRSLISSVSSEAFDAKGKLATPNVLGQEKLFLTKKTQDYALLTSAVLTCLDQVPPADAFRPPYVGTDKPLYRAKDIQWDKLLKLAPVDSVPSWESMERIFDRPWFEIPASWQMQHFGPGLNQPTYGREFTRLSSIASLMLSLDVPNEQKQTLLYSYLQLGIDTYGMTVNGRNWTADGGWWQGRKWVIYFTSILLDRPEMRDLPNTRFQEDMDTYYGKGAHGQTALWQLTYHTHPRPPHQEELRNETNAKLYKMAEGYRFINSASWIGQALVAQHMMAKEIWNHDAYFDYVDQWMNDSEPFKFPKWLPRGCTRSVDVFVEDMWAAHRDSVPDQPGGKDNLKWVWTNMKTRTGEWVDNPKPE